MKKLVLKFLGFYLNTCAIIAPEKAGRLGFNLFCRPFRIKMADRQLQFLKSATSFELQHKGEHIQAYKWGKGPKKILMLHGWQSHSYRWKPYIKALDKNLYTIYSFDAPGHGLSTGKFLNVVIYSEVVQKIIEKIGGVDIIIAHSIGSFTALYTLFKNPELQLQKIIVTACPDSASEFFEAYRGNLGLTTKSMEAIVRRFQLELKQLPQYFSTSNFVKDLKVPGLLIHDEDDDETPVNSSISLHKLWTNSNLIVTKGYGHNLKSIDVIHHILWYLKQENVLEVREVYKRS